MLKVAFLFDPKNDWIRAHFPKELEKTKKFKSEILYDQSQVRNFDIVFVLGYTKILKGEILSDNKILLVVHESNLPEGRGFSPVQWQILEGKNKIPVCLLEVSEAPDAGDIYLKSYIHLDGSELYDDIRSKQAEATFELVTAFLQEYPKLTPYAQVGEKSFYKRRTSKDSKLDVDKTIREQFDLLRISNNQDWPAFFELGGKEYTLKIERKVY